MIVIRMIVIPLLMLAMVDAPAHVAAERAIEWLPFSTPQATYAHAALLLPVELDGVRCTVQLDTGANYAFLDRAATVQPAPRTARLQAGGVARTVPLSDAAFDRIAHGDCANIGRVGNALFDQGTITLDLARGRFSYVQGSTLTGDAQAASLHYVTPAGWDGGFLLVDYRFDDGPRGSALLDTGAALFAITLDDEAAVRRLARDRVTPLTASSAGASIACVIGPLPGVLNVGAYRVPAGLIGSCRKPLPELGARSAWRGGPGRLRRPPHRHRLPGTENGKSTDVLDDYASF